MLAFAAPLNGQTGSASSPNSVMVVPFANVTGNPDVQWLEIGITETVVADLEQLQGLSIVRSAGLDSSTETAPLRDRLALSTAREQGVSWLVSGGFQSLGEQLRITARIIDVATGTIRATVKVDGVLGDTFILQDKIIAGLAPEFASIVQSIPSQAAANLGQRENARARNDQTGLPQGRQEGQDDTLNPFRRRTSPETQPDERGEANPSPTDRVNVSPSRTDTPPTIDGRLDDMVWQTAARITNFVQSQPQDGAPASEASDVYIAYDSSNIYLAFHAHYEDPSIMRSNRSDRDQAGRSDDIFSVYFDPFSDQQRAYVFSVNGYGVQDDSVLGSRSSGGGGGRRGGGGFRGGGGGVPRGDSSWDTLFTSGGQIVDDGFTAELAMALIQKL